MKIQYYIIALSLLLGLSSCDKTNEHILETVKEQTAKEVGKDAMGVTNNIYLLKPNGKNILNSQNLMTELRNYCSNYGEADKLRAEARGYDSSTDPAYRYNPNRYQIAKFNLEQALRLDSIANTFVPKLREAIANYNDEDNSDAIWVYQNYTFKRYIYTGTYDGPYVKNIIYKLSSDGRSISAIYDFRYDIDPVNILSSFAGDNGYTKKRITE